MRILKLIWEVVLLLLIGIGVTLGVVVAVALVGALMALMIAPTIMIFKFVFLGSL